MSRLRGFTIAVAAFALLAVASAQRITFITPPWGAPPDTLLQKFESDTGIKVEVQSMPMDQLYTKVQTASVTHQAPADVIFLSEEAPSNIVTPGFMAPLNDYIQQAGSSLNYSDFERRDFWKINDQIYGIPTYVQLVMMDYNAKKLEQAGFSGPPDTWDALVQEAQALKAKGIDEYPVSFAGRSWSWYIIAQSMGGPLFDGDLNPLFVDNGSGAKAMKLLVDMFNKDKLISPSLLNEVTPHQVFESGVGTFHQSWEGANVLMNNPQQSKQAPNVKYMLIPDKHLTWSLDAAIGLSRYSKHMDAGWKFIQWYVSDPVQRQIYFNVGLVPSRLSVQKALDSQGKIAGYSVIAEQSKYVSQLPRQTSWWGQWDTYVTDQLRRALTQNLDPVTVTKRLADKWVSLRKQYQH